MTNQLQVPLAEQKRFGDKSLTGQLQGYCNSTLQALKNDLKTVEQALKELIREDASLKVLFDLVTSIPGIGMIVATEIILATNEFKGIDDPKKLACHAGVAPFDGAARAAFIGE